MKKIILASASPRRRELLETAGIPFSVCPDVYKRQIVSWAGLVPDFMLPSPIDVGKAFILDFGLLMENARVTLLEAALGLFFGVAVGFLMAVLMERFEKVYQAFYPLIVLTQTVPCLLYTSRCV